MELRNSAPLYFFKCRAVLSVQAPLEICSPPPLPTHTPHAGIHQCRASAHLYQCGGSHEAPTVEWSWTGSPKTNAKHAVETRWRQFAAVCVCVHVGVSQITRVEG